MASIFMRHTKITCIAFLFILFSCGNRAVDAMEEPIAYKVDTLMIDAKDYILFLQYRLHTSDHLQKDGLLYNFNHFDHSIEKIDLNRLELTDKLFLEKEGPNSVSPYV